MKNPFLLGFCALAISSLLWPALPPWPLVLLLPAVAILLYRHYPLCSGACVAIAWLGLYCHMTFDYSHWDGKPQTWVRGEIIASVGGGSDWQSIDIQLVKPKLIWPIQGRVRLSWRSSERPVPGEIWDFQLLPRPITSPLVQGAFNGQRYLLSRHIGLRASVKVARRVSASTSTRQGLLARISESLAGKQQQGLLYALLTGEQQLDESVWRRLRQTGTGHLMAISGLHLSVLGLWLVFLVRGVLDWLKPRQDRLNLLLAMGVALVGCGLYALLAGMAIPTRRAFVMLALVMLLTLSRRFASPWERLLYALAAVLSLDPLSPLSSGFWLSFGALFIILLMVRPMQPSLEGRLPRLKRYAADLLKVQLALSLGLGLLQLLLFGGTSVHSLWINVLMVPWFSLVVIPLALGGLAVYLLLMPFGGGSEVVFAPALWSLAPFDALLKLSDQLPGAWLSLAQSTIAAGLFALLGMLWLWLPLGRSTRLLAIILLLPLGVSALPGREGGWEFHLLDVGQGLAAVVISDRHTLVYDTGAAFGERFSHGERTLVPFLRAKGRHRIDVLIISHEDKDHAGGAAALAAAIPVDLVVSDTLVGRVLPAAAHRSCRPGQLKLGDILVKLIAPAQTPQGRIGNEASCVVRLSDGRHSLLLPGDIEAAAESRLVAGNAELAAEVLVAPHHGSAGSSSPAFIAAVSPELTLIAAGVNNRYGFPKSEVLARYRQQDSAVFLTAVEGQISLYFNEDIRFKGYRQTLAPFWYNQAFGVGARPITE